MGGAFDWLVSFPQTYPELRLELLGRLLLAMILGGAIGWDREQARKPAGLRTNILICVGAALLSDLSIQMAAVTGSADPSRIAAQIVSGVGFLGAGTIIHQRGSVTGLTTAATLWVVAAIGLAVGIGAIVEAVGTTVLVLIALVPLRRFEAKVEAHLADDPDAEHPE
jgi:putative Mg2+ transporter-C (MgtC) family protein